MAISFVGAADLGNNGGSGTLSVSYTCGSGSGRLLVVGIKGDIGGDNITGVSYGGVGMTLAAKHTSSFGGNRWIYLYYLLNPASGSNTVQITTSGGYVIAGAVDYAGVSGSGQPDATYDANLVGPATSITGTITPAAGGTWAVMVAGGYTGGTIAAGTGSTRRTYDAAFSTYGLFDSDAATLAAGVGYSMEAHYPGDSADGLNVAMATFLPAGGGGGSTYTLTAAAGSFALTGQSAALLASRKLTAAQGTFSLSGQAASLKASRRLTAAQGSFSLAGQSASLLASRRLTASQGSFSLSGQPANLAYSGSGSKTLVAACGTFALAGQAASLKATRLLSAACGSFTLAGQPAGLHRGRTLAAGCGSFSLSGQAAILRAARVLAAARGLFVFTGRDAVLDYSGAAGPAPVVIRIPISSSRAVRAGVSSSRTVRIPISP